MRLNLSNLLIIFGVFLVLSGIASGQGVQTRECFDSCIGASSVYEETQQCIYNLGENVVEFFPVNRFLVISPGDSIDFSGNILQNNGDLISIDWYLNNVFSKGDSGVTSLYSVFTRQFNDNSRVTARAQVTSDSGTFSQEENWYITINRTAEVNCVENWYCDWTQCDASGYRYTSRDNCQDINECGTTLNLTFSESCSCIPEYNCDNWDVCNPDYDLTNVLYGVPNLGATQERYCSQTTSCLLESSTIIEDRQCNLQIPVTVEIVDWCYQEYVEIRDGNSDTLVARVKGTTVGNIFSVDIGFTATEYSGTCPYCFDGIKNFDETGIDCGGVCPRCIAKGRYFDYIPYIISFTWLIFALLSIAYIYNNRDELLERTPSERKVSGRTKSIWELLVAGFKSIKLPSLPKSKVVAKEVKLPREVKPVKLSPVVETPKKKWFQFPGISININIGRPSQAQEDERVVTYTPKTIHEIATYRPRRKTHAVVKPVRTRIPLPFGDLRRMLAKWKKVPIYATPPKEYRLRKAISEYMKRRKERKTAREIVKHERRVRRIEKRLVKKQAKALKRRIRKKQVGRHEVDGLKAQLKEWRRKGYYNTFKLEKKLDKLHKK